MLLEVFDAGVDKAKMLCRICEHFDIPRQTIVVFGDQSSDLGMFRVAGTAVAVANAHPDVKAAAHQVIGSNDEDAVPKYIASRALPLP